MSLTNPIETVVDLCAADLAERFAEQRGRAVHPAIAQHVARQAWARHCAHDLARQAVTLDREGRT